MRISQKLIVALRNEVPIDEVIIRILKIEHRYRENHLRFLCPRCCDLHTSTNKKTNLARCFRCKINYNPIDLLIEVNKLTFKEAVSFLEPTLIHYLTKAEVQEKNHSSI